MRTLVVTPTYNERDNIEALVEAVLATSDQLDYLIVDDNSPDGTGELADEIARRNPRFHVIHRAGKLGLGSAYREAFTRALAQGYDAVVSMDGDWSHDPQYLPDLIRAAETSDLVIGSRYLHGISVVNWALSRLIMSAVANEYARLVTGMPFRDCTSGFQCLTRRALESAGLAAIRTSGYSFLIELKYRVVSAGLRGVEVPIVFTQRRAGVSKISKAEILRSMVTPWKMRLGLWERGTTDASASLAGGVDTGRSAKGS
ncbi:MAG: polyprenol monophosphomannose synthase [Deltaproteobacteria bacterium]|nr:polyprenol monophosphomannose synthase [Deltaproteobacteria bacterium]